MLTHPPFCQLLEEYFLTLDRKKWPRGQLLPLVLSPPATIEWSKTIEGVTSVLLPPILPGVNMNAPERFRLTVGHRESYPAIPFLGC